jgi:hypothetical protein
MLVDCLLGMALAAGIAAPPGTCDFRLAESSQYSQWARPLAELGVGASSMININGKLLGCGRNVSLSAFLAQTPEEVRRMVAQRVVPIVMGGINTSSLLVVDIEKPVRPDHFWQYNDTTLRNVVKALRLRLSTLLQIMPNATVSMYGAPTRLHLRQSETGYRRASELGLFDDVNYTTPSLYLSPGQDPANITQEVLAAATSVTRVSGEPVPLAPFLSWVHEGSPNSSHYHCAVTAAAMQTQLRVLARAGRKRVPIIAWFDGSDNKTDMCGNFANQLQWMKRNKFVPERCLHLAY